MYLFVFMAWDVKMILMQATSITSVIGRGGPYKFGPKKSRFSVPTRSNGVMDLPASKS
jgi:hypothetical protein